MPEIVSWPEGAIYLWTGTATASALVGYARDVNATIVWGIDNYQTLDTAWHNVYTGQRADVGIGQFYTTDALTLWKMAEAKTGVHVHLKHTGVYGSAGMYLYSGAIDSVQLAGNEGQHITFSVQFHANRWSAY